MATAKRFEELRVWQSARIMVQQVYQITREGSFARDFGLRDQIQRAAVSVMSNIAEGFHAGSNVEFLRFLRYARRSLAEVQSQFYTALDLAYITKDKFDAVYAHSEITFRQLNAFIAYLHSHNKRAVKEVQATYQTANENVVPIIELPDEFYTSTNLTNPTNAPNNHTPTSEWSNL